MSATDRRTLPPADATLPTCREVITRLLDYLAEELDAPSRRGFERHFERCPSCLAYLATYRQAVELGRLAVRRAEEDETADDAARADDLMRALLAARSRPNA